MPSLQRIDEDQWVLHDMSENETLQIACLGAALPMAQVFEGVDTEPR